MHLDNRGLPLSTASAKAAAALDLRPTSARTVRFAPALYPAALFLSALLLFAIQPMFSKMVLPRIGGAAAVWSVAMVFFQAALLLGYAYAHLLSRTLSPAPAQDQWSRFRDAFITRYETREVPLVEVLDEESGIGFGGPAEDTAQAPLVADLVFPGRAEPKQVSWSARDAHLLRLHNRALEQTDSGAFADALLEDMPPSPPDQASIVAANRAGAALSS
jgi:hypothetical protein